MLLNYQRDTIRERKDGHTEAQRCRIPMKLYKRTNWDMKNKHEEIQRDTRDTKRPKWNAKHPWWDAKWLNWHENTTQMEQRGTTKAEFTTSLKKYKIRHKYPKGAEIKTAPKWHPNKQNLLYEPTIICIGKVSGLCVSLLVKVSHFWAVWVGGLYTPKGVVVS